MICPSKMCVKEIPDDSAFCDQCGVHLGKCEKCGAIALSKRCGKCGGIITLITVSTEEKKLLFCHSEGWTLDIKDGDILGRTTGQHSSRLGAFPVISSRHAQVAKQGEKWIFTDLGSTNKSYLNRQVLQANTPTELNDGDEILLANVSFVVKIG